MERARPEHPALEVAKGKVLDVANRVLVANGHPGNAAFAPTERTIGHAALTPDLSATATFIARGPVGAPARPQELVKLLRQAGLELAIGQQDPRARKYGCTRWWTSPARPHPQGQATDLHIEFVSRGARGAFLKAAIQSLTAGRRRALPLTEQWRLDRVDDYLSSEDLAHRRLYGSREQVKALKDREVARAKDAGAQDAWTAWRGRHLILFLRLASRGSSLVVEHTLQPRGRHPARRGGDLF